MMNPYYGYQPQPSRDIPFVRGMQGAEGFYLPPNSRVILMDTEQSRFYVKAVNQSGVPEITAYDFTPVPKEEPQEYITRKEFEQWKAMMTHEPSASNQQPVSIDEF